MSPDTSQGNTPSGNGRRSRRPASSLTAGIEAASSEVTSSTPKGIAQEDTETASPASETSPPEENSGKATNEAHSETQPLKRGTETSSTSEPPTAAASTTGTANLPVDRLFQPAPEVDPATLKRYMEWLERTLKSIDNIRRMLIERNNELAQGVQAARREKVPEQEMQRLAQYWNWEIPD